VIPFEGLTKIAEKRRCTVVCFFGVFLGITKQKIGIGLVGNNGVQKGIKAGII